MKTAQAEERGPSVDPAKCFSLHLEHHRLLPVTESIWRLGGASLLAERWRRLLSSVLLLKTSERVVVQTTSTLLPTVER